MINITRLLKGWYKLGRFGKPAGYLYLYWPVMWGVASNCDFYSMLSWSPIFLMGAINLRSAGCVINDYFDKQLDKNVQRTKQRPLASGQITPIQSLPLIFINCAFGLLVLSQLNFTSILLSFSIVPMAVLYPLSKKYFSCPQLILGLVFNWGVFIGSAATNYEGMILYNNIPLYLIGVCWTLIYDTIYAMQDLDDDKRMNNNSMAILIEGYQKIVFSMLIGISYVLFFTYFYIHQLQNYQIVSTLFHLGYLITVLSVFMNNNYAGGFKRLQLIGLFLTLILSFLPKKQIIL